MFVFLDRKSKLESSTHEISSQYLHIIQKGNFLKILTRSSLVQSFGSIPQSNPKL